jgi:hypothetical protein
MPDPVTTAELTALLNDSLEVGLSARPGASAPGPGVSPPRPHFGGGVQGALPGFSGGVNSSALDSSSFSAASTAALNSSRTTPVESPMATRSGDQKPAPQFGDAFSPVRLVWVDAAFVQSSCCGLIGKGGDKFCTKRRNGDDTTCGTRSHAKKADLQMDFIYFWETAKNLGHVSPSLDSQVPLGNLVWDMRGEELTRLQFKELFEAVQAGDASDAAELATIKSKILDPSSGVGFTPRKKPRYSEEWEYPEVEALPPIDEIPAGLGETELQSHISEHWETLVKSVETLKKVAARNSHYEKEMDTLGNDVDALRSALARINNLVGSPTDGIAFDLFAMTESTEEALMDLDKIVVKKLTPNLADAEARITKAQAEIAKFKSSTGDQLMSRLGDLETQVRTLEGTSTPDVLTGIVVQIRKSLVDDIFPAVRNLWGMYERMTTGSLGTCTPGDSHTPGTALLDRMESLEESGRNILARLGNSSPGGDVGVGPASSLIGISQRLAQLEKHLQQRRAPGAHPEPLPGLGLFGGAPDPRPHSPPQFAPGVGGFTGTHSGLSDARLATLEARVMDLEAQLDNVTVSMGGITFKSVNDCESFILENVPGNTYAHFYDLVSLLQRAWGANHVGVREVWEKTYALRKAGFTSQGEAVILASMNTVLPSCLGELTGRISECHLPLPALATHECWTSKGYQMGRRKDIQDGIIRVMLSLEENVRDVFRGYEQGRCVVSEMLTLSRAHWSSMERMIDTFYAEFLVTSTSKDAWRLTSLIVKTVFEAVHQVRSAGSDLSDIVSPSKRAAKVMWATMQAHRVMRTFIDADFRNDPKIAPVIVLHLLENRVSRQDVDSLQTKIQTQSGLLQQQRRDLDKMISTVNGMKKGGGRGGRADEEDTG